MRANTCCTVSLKGYTVLLRRSHSSMRCTSNESRVSTCKDAHHLLLTIQADKSTEARACSKHTLHMQGRSFLAAENQVMQSHRLCMKHPPPRYHRESTSMPHKERCKGRDTRRMGVASSTKGVHVRKCFTWTVACAVALVARPATPLARTGLVIRPVRPCMCTQNGKFILSSLYTSACACMGYYQPKNKDASESLLMP